MVALFSKIFLNYIDNFDSKKYTWNRLQPLCIFERPLESTSAASRRLAKSGKCCVKPQLSGSGGLGSGDLGIWGSGGDQIQPGRLAPPTGC